MDGNLSEIRLDDFMRFVGRLVFRATLVSFPVPQAGSSTGWQRFPWRTRKNCRSPLWFVCLSNSLPRQKHDKYRAFCKSANIDGIRPHDTVGCMQLLPARLCAAEVPIGGHLTPHRTRPPRAFYLCATPLPNRIPKKKTNLRTRVINTWATVLEETSP